MMKSFNKLFYLPFLLSFVLLALLSADTLADPFEVTSIRVEKMPGDCQTTLFATIRNNSGQVTNSGLFVYATQFKTIQNNKKMSSLIGNVRLDNLPAGQSREISYRYFQDHDKTDAAFRFRVVSDTLAYTERDLPPLNETYTGKLNSPNVDTASNRFTCTIVNLGSVALPKPVIQFFTASADAPTDFKPGGGGIASQCILPGSSFNMTRSWQPKPPGSVTKVALRAGGMTLDQKIIGGQTAKKVAPAIRTLEKKAVKAKPARIKTLLKK